MKKNFRNYICFQISNKISSLTNYEINTKTQKTNKLIILRFEISQWPYNLLYYFNIQYLNQKEKPKIKEKIQILIISN